MTQFRGERRGVCPTWMTRGAYAATFAMNSFSGFDVGKRYAGSMARVDPLQKLVPSILDRLTDPETGTGGQPGYTLHDMMESVREDLEDLLNTKQTLGPMAKNRERVRNSILGYGLPEITSMPAITPQQRQDIARVVEATVIRNEPRLRDVRVTLLNPEGEKLPSLRFRIDARLMIEPAPEVAFDATAKETGQLTLQLSTKPTES
ncbi:MAG: type VI secretion system baseplate subunit TssE [Planctomycetes bacterium]|nr:type VI secretion system baseplate subunit TssE [Planctomycetota bacterium]